MAGKFEVLSGIPRSVVMKEAEWDTTTINGLPDSSFAVVSKGGQKDERGKTAPRSLRHLPHHKANGSLDIPHLRNALARLPQTDLSLEDRAEAKKHLCAHAKDSEIVSAVCGEEPLEHEEDKAVAALRKQLTETEAKLTEAKNANATTPESTDMVLLRKQLIETEAKLSNSRKQTASAQARYHGFVEAIKGTHPIISVQRSWSLGPQKMIAEQMRVLREFEAQSRT